METLVYRCEGFSPSLSLLMPTFAFPETPPRLTSQLQRRWNAPLPSDIKNVETIASVIRLCPIIIHAQPLD
jgi:hypothetical protein